MVATGRAYAFASASRSRSSAAANASSDGRWFLSIRHAGQRLLLAGPQPAGEIRECGLRMEPALPQFQQPYAPGVSVAMLLLGQQVAIRRFDIDADQDRQVGLKDFVVGAERHRGQVLT